MGKSEAGGKDTEELLIKMLSALDQVSSKDLCMAIKYTQTSYAPKLVRWLMGYFAARIRDGDGYDGEALGQLIGPAFSQITENKKITADQAFRLTQGKGKYSRTHGESHYIQATALVLIEMRKGQQWIHAVETVAKLIPLSESMVKKVFAIYRPFMSHLPDEVLVELCNGPFEPSRQPDKSKAKSKAV